MKKGETYESSEVEKADGIIAKYADADMSCDELFELLVQNGISHALASGMANDMRPLG